MTENPEPSGDERDEDTAGHVLGRAGGSQDPLRDPTAPKADGSDADDTADDNGEQPRA